MLANIITKPFINTDIIMTVIITMVMIVTGSDVVAVIAEYTLSVFLYLYLYGIMIYNIKDELSTY